MKRFFSPFFFISILTLISCIYILITDESGWGLVGVFYLAPAALVILLIDFILKKGFNKLKKVNIIELIVVGILVFAYYYGERIKTLEISDDFDKEYVSIIYDVENEKGLSITPLTWSKTIEIPENGILLTSSGFNKNLPETRMKFQSGTSVTIKESGKGFVEFPESQFEFNGKVYKYRSWKIQEGFCCMWSSNESDSLNIALKAEFEKIKASR